MKVILIQKGKTVVKRSIHATWTGLGTEARERLMLAGVFCAYCLLAFFIAEILSAHRLAQIPQASEEQQILVGLFSVTCGLISALGIVFAVVLLLAPGDKR